jgi:glycosyltransferase involved in cell wall biosynthesis
MRIGLITADFYPNVGGVAAHVVELGRALVRLGHNVDVFTLPLGDQQESFSELHGMQVYRPSIPRGKPLYSWLLSRWLTKQLRRNPVDVMHVHGLRPLEATRGLTCPVIFTNHTSGFLKRIERGDSERRRMQRRLSHVSSVLAPSDELVEATRRVGYPGPVSFISNGVDTERFFPGDSPCRKQWSIGDDETVVLLARRLVEKNGVTVFAEAVTRLKNKTARIVFAGDGDERSNVQSILARGESGDRCTFLGNVPNTQMPDIYRAADISVLPSFMEATSITGLESMATGLPLVGTNVGGIPAIIDDKRTGLLVEPRDPDALAAAMDRLIEDADLRRQFGDAAQERATKEFSWEGIASRTVDAYGLSRTKVQETAKQNSLSRTTVQETAKQNSQSRTEVQETADEDVLPRTSLHGESVDADDQHSQSSNRRVA